MKPFIPMSKFRFGAIGLSFPGVSGYILSLSGVQLPFVGAGDFPMFLSGMLLRQCRCRYFPMSHRDSTFFNALQYSFGKFRLIYSAHLAYSAYSQRRHEMRFEAAFFLLPAPTSTRLEIISGSSRINCGRRSCLGTQTAARLNLKPRSRNSGVGNVELSSESLGPSETTSPWGRR